MFSLNFLYYSRNKVFGKQLQFEEGYLMAKLIFDVKNMKCGGCVSAIEAALAEIDGVKEIEVSLDRHQATVVSTLADDLAGDHVAESIAKVITDAGFPATIV